MSPYFVTDLQEEKCFIMCVGMSLGYVHEYTGRIIKVEKLPAYVSMTLCLMFSHKTSAKMIHRCNQVLREENVLKTSQDETLVTLPIANSRASQRLAMRNRFHLIMLNKDLWIIKDITTFIERLFYYLFNPNTRFTSFLLCPSSRSIAYTLVHRDQHLSTLNTL